MASAGRILIMPKGTYDSSATYEMLDLVFHNGVSWLAKKTVIGIEPSVSNEGYWFKLCESTDLTELNNAIIELESAMSMLQASIVDLTANGAKKTDLDGYLKLSGGDLTGSLSFNNGKGVLSADANAAFIRAKKDANNYRNIGVDNPLQASNINDWLKLVDCSNGTTKQYKIFGEHNIELLKTLISASISGVKFYTGTLGDNGTNTTRRIPCSFAPKLICIVGKPSSGAYCSLSVILPDMGVGVTAAMAGSASMGDLTATRDGNDVIISHSFYPDMIPYYACYSANMKYSYICIG